MRRKLVGHVAVCVLASTALEADKSLAQEVEGARTLETVTVTAERREANLQDVPLAVQALDADLMERAGIADLSALQMATPSVVVSNVSSNVNAYIRGVGSTVQGSGFSPSVAIYIDGVYVSRLTSGSFDLANVEQVQILKGPQGALYGRSATGGALVVTTRTPRPGSELEGDFSFTVGDFNNRIYSGEVSAGLGERWAFRLSGEHRTRDGFVKNLTPAGLSLSTEDLDDRDSLSLGGVLTFEPTDNLSFVLRGSYFKSKDRAGMAYQPVGLDLAVPPFGLDGTSTVLVGTMIQFGLPVLDALAAAPDFQYPVQFGTAFDTNRNGYTNGLLSGNSLDGQFNHLQLSTVSLKADWDVGPVTLTSITAFTESKSDATVQVIGADPHSLPARFQGGSIGFSGDLPSDASTQEFQITSNTGPVEWVGGFYYINEDGKTDLTGDLFGLSLYSARNDWNVESISGFGQATFPIIGNLSGTIGARYTDETFTLDDRYDPADPRSVSPLLPNFGSRKQSSSETTYTARLSYSADSWLAYGALSTGFKAGTLSAINPSSPGVAPEEIASYEIGVKSDLTDRLRLNLAAFIYDYENIHIAFTDSTTGASLLVNGTGGEVKGFEVDFIALVTDWLTLRGGATVLDTQYDQNVVALGNIVELGGKKLVGAPDVAVSIGADIVFPFVTSGALILSTTTSLNSGYYFDGENKVGTGGANDKGFTVVNLNLGYQPHDAKWRASIWANNVTDEEYYASGMTQGFINRQGIPASPAHFGVTIGYRF